MTSEKKQDSGGAREDANNTKNSDIQYILNDIGGSFGKFQWLNYVLFAIPISLSGLVSLTYVFTALNLDYRCYIPECDNIDNPVYGADWLQDAIPFTNSKPMNCHRYQPVEIENNTSNYFLMGDRFIDVDKQICSKGMFNRSVIIKCDQDGLIYRTDEITIVNEFGISCAENEWKLAIIGAYNNFARLLFMPLVGIISDRFGRKTILMLGLCGSCVAGLIQSFSTSYNMFIVFELLNAAVASAVYPAGFILGMEWAEVRHRVIVSCIVTFLYPVGQALAGVFALYAKDFRVFLRLAFVPGLIMTALLVIAPESLRWLLVKGKRDRIHRLLSKAAKINKLQISQRTFDIVNEKCAERKTELDHVSCSNSSNISLRLIFTKKTLVVRFFILAFCWITGTFVSYGTNITSVSLSGDKYISYIIVAMGGVPSGLLTYFMLEHMGRPKCISLSLVITGVSIITAKLLPESYSILALILFFIGKCFITHSFAAIYIYTIELWPTPQRHSIMALCSTIGRIGSILAPLAPLLAHYMDLGPYLSFAGVSIIAGLLILILPETLNSDLPDTLEETLNIGKIPKR